MAFQSYVVPLRESLPIELDEKLINQVLEQAQDLKSWVLLFILGTKPCYNKVFGSLQACAKQGLPLLVFDANQHYDHNLVHGMDEFGFRPYLAGNLQIRGDLCQKSVELFEKSVWLARYFKEKWPHVKVIPVVNGDTILCPMVSGAWMMARNERSIHNEAGMRGMAPDSFLNMNPEISVHDFMEGQQSGEWHLLRAEPYPEQWDTFVASAGCDFHFAPVALNRDHLIREGYPKDQIFVTNALVVDAMLHLKKGKIEQSIFEIYPQLGVGKWLRMDIHRKENLSEHRFRAIFESLESLIANGFSVNLVLLNGTKHAIQRWGLTERFEALKKSPHFLPTEVWPAYRNVLEFFESDHFWAALTDSGGMQEDMNYLRKPCMTIRFCTDRPESVMNRSGNILIPPINGKLMSRFIQGILGDEQLIGKIRPERSIYGPGAGVGFAEGIAPFAYGNRSPLRFAPDLLELSDPDQTHEIDF